MAVKFLDAGGYGTDANGAAAIYWAVNHGADVLSNSWGQALPSMVLEEAINYACSNGVIVVAAPGWLMRSA
jgi:subtilisin family serine protease